MLAERREHAEPAWGPGNVRTRGRPTARELAWCRNEDGFGRLVIAAPGKRSARELSKGWHRGLDWGAGGIACVRSGAVTPPQVVVLAANGSGRRAIARGPVGGFEATGLVEPRAVTWKSGSATVHGLLWRAADGVGACAAPGRCSCSCTAARPARRSPTGRRRSRRSCSAGWTVLQPDYRGSTGHGRAYTQALAGHWGERDVADVAAGIRHAEKEGWADAARVAIMGGSAGGMTVLLVAAQHPDLVQAVVALVSRCATSSTSPRRRTGSSRATRCASSARCPTRPTRTAIVRRSRARARSARRCCCCTATTTRRCPSRSRRRSRRRVRAAGVPVERHVYEGEGHGWRAAATIADDFERVDAFLDAVGASALSAARRSDDGYQGPKRGADRAVLLAHGAGADMHAAALTVVADALADARIPSLRFDFPYRRAGRRAPDRPPVLLAAVREAAAELARRAKLPLDRLVLGGRSMGGRIASMVAADDADRVPALGLALLGYPLAPAGQARDSCASSTSRA